MIDQVNRIYACNAFPFVYIYPEQLRYSVGRCGIGYIYRKHSLEAEDRRILTQSLSAARVYIIRNYRSFHPRAHSPLIALKSARYYRASR